MKRRFKRYEVVTQRVEYVQRPNKETTQSQLSDSKVFQPPVNMHCIRKAKCARERRERISPPHGECGQSKREGRTFIHHEESVIDPSSVTGYTLSLGGVTPLS